MSRMRRKLLGYLLAALGAMLFVFEGAPAMALNLMTWNIQGATNNINGQEFDMWSLVLGRMVTNDKQIAAIQEAGNPDEIERQLRRRAQGAIRTDTIDDAPGLPAGFVIRRIRARIGSSSYTVYVLNDTTDPNSNRVALVLRNVEGNNLRVIQIPDAPRPALGISVQGTTYFSVHSPASNAALEAGRTALSLISEISGNWVALGDWNVDIGNANNPRNPRGGNPSTPFGSDIANPDLVGAQVYRTDRNTQNARADGGPQRALDYAFANYPFANPQGAVIDRPDSSSPSDHLPVNYDDTPLQGGGDNPPSPPGDDPSSVLPSDSDLLDNRYDGQCGRLKEPESGSILGVFGVEGDVLGSLRLIQQPATASAFFGDSLVDTFCFRRFRDNVYIVRLNGFGNPTVQSNGKRVLLSQDEVNGFDAWILRFEEGRVASEDDNTTIVESSDRVTLVNSETGRPLTATDDGITNGGGDGTVFELDLVTEE